MSARLTATAMTAAIVCALLASIAPRVVHAQTLQKIMIVTSPIEPAAAVYYAKENGFFTKAGLDVDIEQNPSTPAAVSAVLSGTYDVAYATIPTLAAAHSKNLPLVIIAPGCGESAVHFEGAIMVGPNSAIKTGKDLNGKTLATAGLSTIAEYLPRAWVDKNGGDSSTIKFVEMPFSTTGDAIASGKVDGAFVVEPFYTLALKKGQARLLATGTDAVSNGEYLDSGWFSTSAWAKAHPDAVARFMRAISDAAAWANANPAKVVPILTKYFKSDPSLLGETKRPFYPERLSAAAVQPYVDVTAKYAKFPPFKADELIYTPSK